MTDHVAHPLSMNTAPATVSRLFERLTTLARQLTSVHRPVTVAEILAAALTEELAPDRLEVMLLDLDTSTLRVVYRAGAAPARGEEALLQLALRRGPLVRGRDIPEPPDAQVDLGGDAPASWIGAPIVALGRAIGAVSLGSDSPDAWGPTEREWVTAAAAQAGIALQNARLFDLLSTGKREWELTVDAISHAICIVDDQGVVRRANRVFAELVHQPVTALPGRDWLSLLPAAWADVVARALARPGAPSLEIRTGDRILLVNAIPMAGTDAGSAVLMFEDHTETRRLGDQLIQSEKMSAIGQLIAGVAHDLNNPLTSVVGFSDFLHESGVPAALREPLRIIRQEAERAANIVRNLLSFARRQEGERRVQPIRPVLESTLALLRNELMTRKVDATLETAPELPDVAINANQIKQVFLNVINNAAQAIASTGRPGRLWVTARPRPDGLAVSVADDGPGVPGEIAPRVFDPFFTTKAEGEGTGLGLSICQGIVKEHGGLITLEATPGGGATFTVELPGAVRPARVSIPTPTAAISAPLRVLVVDDEPPILHYMRATLESWGHGVVVASDGSEALDLARADPFDVIICDLRMPRLGGREVFEILERQQPDLAARLVFATGDTVRGDTLDFLESLGRPYLHKPFTLAELRNVLASVVHRQG